MYKLNISLALLLFSGRFKWNDLFSCCWRVWCLYFTGGKYQSKLKVVKSQLKCALNLHQICIKKFYSGIKYGAFLMLWC